MARILRGYLSLLERHPWRTTAVGSGVLMCTGDFIAQTAVEKKPVTQYSPTRGAKFLAFGCLLTGPILRSWYLVLERVVKGSSKIAPLQKVALDQILFTPCFLAFFLFTMTYWDTKSLSAVNKKFSLDYYTVWLNAMKDYREILLDNWKLWPSAQLINFYFVPFKHRVLYVNFVALFWNTYLAYMSQKDSPERLRTA